ncbi:MAG: MotA/TolQ/ExbB proton channel family protein [Bacteroidetes bacterium]|nr:MotA/TolQ/ExbB proton channel family protein [Bacteroidota bacterium]
MELFEKILFYLSTGLLLPVIILILWFIIRGIILIFQCYLCYVERLRVNKQLKPFLEERSISEIKDLSGNKQLLSRFIQKLLANQNDLSYRDKILSDFEVECQKDLDKSRTLSKLGPMLGLMGTLIPMGPALAGLAAGDIAAMSSQMQIAFNTTVLGLLIGGIGFLTLQLKQRWYASDLNVIEYVNTSITGELNEKE